MGRPGSGASVGGPEMALLGKRLSLRKLKAMLGREVGVSDWFVVTQERIDAFAAATEDRQ